MRLLAFLANVPQLMPAERFPRKIPAQRRSRETVDVILVAAARIFESRGWTGTTTNRVAETAGVSVGSLYQYFPGKLALLAALKERFVVQLLRKLGAELGQPDGTFDARWRGAIRALLAAYHAQRPLLLLFAENLPVRLHSSTGREAPHLALLRRFFNRHRRALRDRDPALAALVTGEMVDAVARGALRDRSHDFSNGRLETELVEASLLYLRGRPSATRRGRSPSPRKPTGKKRP